MACSTPPSSEPAGPWATSSEQPVAELGLPLSARRRLQQPPPDELSVDESNPETQAVDRFR
jgi:hypothetical protein